MGFYHFGESKDTSPDAEVLMASYDRPKANEAGNRIVLLACPSVAIRQIDRVWGLKCGASA